MEQGEPNQVGDLTKLEKWVEAKENEMHPPHKSGDVDSNGDSDNKLQCCNNGITQPNSSEWDKMSNQQKRIQQT